MIDPAAQAIVFAAAGASVTVAIQEAFREAGERADWRSRCNHQWGPVWEVGERCYTGPAAGARFFRQSCLACGQSLDVNEDGSPYVPATKRDP